MEVRGWKLEIGDWKMETGDWMLEDRNRKFPLKSIL